MRRRVERVMMTAACAFGVAGVWGAFAVTQLGYVWPYPQELPDTISFHAATYFKRDGCHTRRWWDSHGGIGGARTAGRVGTLPSAVGVGGIPEYGLHRHAFDGYLLVPSGRCLVQYEANASGD
jgi:hypothetical protein